MGELLATILWLLPMVLLQNWDAHCWRCSHPGGRYSVHLAMASVVIIKQIGLGLALAIFIDATIVRALVVPSTNEADGSSQLVEMLQNGLRASSDNPQKT